ncbi:hypothetical protein Taro_038672 [Colocasia esculenta]|uniref:Thioredoxin domain-containing protein n=1 Tax=Colocasia esculenta TaxID=4460 RepID=A0A843WPB7_COLES|nr:hypothetical protein [Colocasia esculenta]
MSIMVAAVFHIARKVTGMTLDKDLGNGLKNAFYSVLFYASWCPFSQATRPTFDALSTMFPPIRHLAVESSSAAPRYGVHRFPSILIMNGTTRVIYHGSKDLNSLVLLYKRVTGLEPAADVSVDQYMEFGNKGSIWTWNTSPREILTREPYLAFSFLFLFFRAFLYISPWILPMLRTVWFTYVWHADQGIFSEWSHLPWQALQINDAKRLWSKLRLSSKARNIQKGANNARAWASSLTSVSLGEPSSSRTLVGS